MHTSDGSVPGGKPGRSSSVDPAASDASPVCGFPLTRMNKSGTFTCRNPPVEGGAHCHLHVGQTPDPEAIELERLRLLQEAAERHAFAADRAIGVGDNGDKDLAFNRNARTAATLLRTRRALAKPKDEPAPDEPVKVDIADNARSPAADAAAPEPTDPKPDGAKTDE